LAAIPLKGIAEGAVLKDPYFQSRAQNRQDQRRWALARQLLQAQPGFAASEKMARDRIEAIQREAPAESRKYRSGARANLVFECFDIKADARLGLISDKETLDAFIVVLDVAEREAWRDFTGVREGILPPVGTLASHAKELDRRKTHWITEAYGRLAASEQHSARPGAEVAGKGEELGPTASAAPERTETMCDKIPVDSGTPEPAVDESVGAGAGAQQSAGADESRPRRGRPRQKPNLHPEVELFLDRVSGKAGRPITIAEFCLVSKFGDDTVFGFWRQGNTERCSETQAKRFDKTLKLSPEQFLAKLDEMPAKSR
jgi:hypothetical protein